MADENVISQELAVKEVQSFVKKWDDKKKDEWEIERDYPNILEAVQLGLLTFDADMKPSLKLKYPLLTDEGSEALSELKFRTRIRPQELANVMKGLNIAQNQVEYTNRCFAFLTGQPISMLNKLEKFDFKVIEQVSTVFL